MRPVLDACCGSRMFWFDKTDERAVFMDCRDVEDVLCDGRKLEVKPDVLGDFRSIDFPDKSFHLVVFDPPHLVQGGENSWLIKKYGRLDKDTWPDDFKRGFSECFRVLRNHGVLIFKWNEEQVSLKKILELTPEKPLFGNRRSKTHWVVFIKSEEESHGSEASTG